MKNGRYVYFYVYTLKKISYRQLIGLCNAKRALATRAKARASSIYLPQNLFTRWSPGQIMEQMVYTEGSTEHGNTLLMTEGGMDVFIRKN